MAYSPGGWMILLGGTLENGPPGMKKGITDINIGRKA
jgi:hypothetical protein